ncbi:helix-turn-helix domain-containing protein [Metabacillus malikii]|uniref:Transcriptional regulator with XRE-family HTH domain n=1 Tax=Metabacillus malikii TaxID=1504265 RepID=A0ABT9ZME5_9BACI|nr:helix-turn-helix transcriptional regulator [Metabacillus malikii]MDQ0233461.1 transcriptional regulator with XRE-family HTH domain [Metabacillus malikii]
MYANRLKELRIAHGYTMEEVGKRVGLKKSSYASYESRYRQPPLEKLKGFSQLYGVSVDYILGLSNERNNEEFIRMKLKELCLKRGLDWESLDIPEDLFLILESILDRAVHNNKQNTQTV